MNGVNSLFGTQAELVSKLRSMAQTGTKPADMVHMLIAHHDVDGNVDRNLIVQYFSEAFCFSDGEAYPIFGWLPDNKGELDDSNIDDLLGKRIEKARKEWDKARSA